MPKYVTLEWSEYTRLKDDERRFMNEARDLKDFKDKLLVILDTPENKKYYNLTGPLPPESWRPLTNEQIIELVRKDHV